MTVCLSLTACLILSSCTTATATTTATTTIVVGANQSLVIGRITEINGNDVVLALAKEGAVTVQSGDAASASGQTQSSRQRPSGQGGQTVPSGQAGQTQSAGQQPVVTGTDTSGQPASSGQSTPSGQSMPSGQQGQRQRPSGQSGQTVPSGQSAASSTASATTTSAGNGTRSGTTSASGSGTKSSQQATVTYSLTGETLSTRIPVGVKVSTQKGTVTTFSRLAVGDMIKILMEKSDSGSFVPVAVWIVG